MEARTYNAYAPWPAELEVAVTELRGVVIFDGWRFWLSDETRDYADEARTIPLAGGLTFNITVPCYDSYHPEHYRPVHHAHPVPAATFNRQSWERWLFDRIMETLRHEAAECIMFEVAQANGMTITRRPWAPLHGPGDDPYVLHEYASEEQRNTSFRGVVKGS